MPRRSNRQHWVDLTDLLTEQGIEAMKAGKDIGINVGQILKFDYEGSGTNFKVMRLDRKRGKLWGREVELYKPEDVEVVDKEHSDDA